MQKISFVIPTSNNLKYVKNAYLSVTKFAPEHQVIILDDASTDGTIEWLKEIDAQVNDPRKFLWFRNDGPRLGHTILYDKGIELAHNEVVSILHADMYIGPNYVENALKHLTRKSVVSATRIEPPLHPEGNEKIVRDFGLWPNTFKEQEFLKFVAEEQERSRSKITQGIFAPWFIYKEDFQAIGGHDPLFAPFPYEDSDIFQRFMLAGYRIVQSRDSLVYHLTCRGHKWTDDTNLGQTDDFFKVSEEKARRNYIRKWQSWIKNDEFHLPIIPPRFSIAAIITDVPNVAVLEQLEIWFDSVCIESDELKEQYIHIEQPKTKYNLSKKIVTDPMHSDLTRADVLVKFSIDKITQEDFSNISNMSIILDSLKGSVELGETYEIGNLEVTVRNLTNKVDNILLQHMFNGV
jgi:glycosyltransferase involved in cell wall biosynthesis